VNVAVDPATTVVSSGCVPTTGAGGNTDVDGALVTVVNGEPAPAEV
jgi:hypothetical protein